MRAASTWAICIATAFALIASPAVGQEDSFQRRDEAQARFRRGLQLYEEDDFRAALAELERAYELAPSYRIRFNIGQVRFQLQDYAGAIRAFQLYLEEGGDKVDPERRAQVESDIERLRDRVASIRVTTSEPGAEVFVDDVLVGTTPLESHVIVSAGRRTVTARLEGYLPVTRVVDIAGADSLDLRLILAKPRPVEIRTSRPVATPEPTRVRAPWPESEARPVPWEGWVITGVLAAGATVTGILALRASSDLKEKRETADVGSSQLDDAGSAARRYAIATDVLAAGALTVGGLSLYLTLDRDTDAGVDGSLRSVGFAGVF